MGYVSSKTLALQVLNLMQTAVHAPIFSAVGLSPVLYPYYDPDTIGLAFTKLVDALRAAVPRSVFVLHACAHNPTGVDPTRAQWHQIADVMVERGHYAFFDCAYQGFASGDLDADAWAVREFVRRGVPMLVCQVSSRSVCLSKLDVKRPPELR